MQERARRAVGAHDWMWTTPGLQMNVSRLSLPWFGQRHPNPVFLNHCFPPGARKGFRVAPFSAKVDEKMNSQLGKLRALNKKLGSFLLEFTLDPEHQEQSISSAEIAVLLSEVLELSRLPNEMGAVRDAAFEFEWNEYRENLERLRGVLPILEKRLRTERSALELERAMISRGNLREKRKG
jgi:hypothetical protein